MTQLKARTKLACEIARIDPARFNEAVHFNKYHCAPSTSPGSARVFTEDDIVALMIYRQMLDAGMSSEKAGAYACEALARFRDKQEVEVVSYVVSTTGFAGMFVGAVRPEGKYGAFADKAFSLSFYVNELRAYVRQCLEYERSILGED